MRAAVLLAALLCWAPTGPVAAAERLPRAVLIIDEADPSDGVPTVFSTTLRRAVTEAQPHVAVYAETLDFTRFTGTQQEAVLRSYLREKYHDVKFGAIVAVGASALELAMRWRPDLWRGTPIVFGAVDELSLSQTKLEPGVTGMLMQRSIRSMVDAARLAVPRLKRVVMLGGTLKRDVYRRQYLAELPRLAQEIAVTNLTGRPLGEQLEQARGLTGDTAILYTSLFIDDAGTRYSSPEALAEIARVASRPIIVDVASLVGAGATGGFAINNESYGEQVAGLVLRVVNGADVTAIPVAASEFTRPVFDRRQLERWRISEASLPPGSEVRFRAQTAWEQYHWQIVLIALALVGQTALIVGLLLQRRGRVRAESEVRHRRAELAQASRLALAGELAASVAHEINQPLGAILANAGAAQVLLRRGAVDVNELQDILADIKSADLRASEVIRRVRGLVTMRQGEREPVEVNAMIREVLAFLRGELERRDIAVETYLGPKLPAVLVDRVQFQQALVNLYVNAMEAMTDNPPGKRRLEVHSALRDDGIEIAVADAGPGIDPAHLPKLFDSFFTTKAQGTGLGLSITRSIVEAHAGRLSAENRDEGGARFRMLLPAAAEFAR